MPTEWYVRLGNVQRGPISSEMLKQLALKGKIKPEMLLRKGPTGNWVPVNRVKGLLPAPTTVKTPAPAPRPGPASQPRPAQPATPSTPAVDTAPTDKPPAPVPPLGPASQPPPAQPVVPPVVAPDTTPTESTRPCPTCGEAILPDATDCEHCGAALDEEPPASKPFVKTGAKQGRCPASGFDWPALRWHSWACFLCSSRRSSFTECSQNRPTNLSASGKWLAGGIAFSSPVTGPQK